MSSSKVLLILGAGGNIGTSVAKLFSQNGYKVALAARRLKDEVNDDGQLQIQLDLAKPDTVDSAFDKVSKKFGPPNVVVYNAAAVHFVKGDSPFDISVNDFEQDDAVNVSSALAAAKQAVQGFEKLPSSVAKSFIYTGNFLNNPDNAMPAMISAGMGKSAAAHMVAVAAKVYSPKGYNFYYADERKEDGKAVVRDISGPNAAEHYLTLAESKEQQPWLQTFVGGQGYKEFTF